MGFVNKFFVNLFFGVADARSTFSFAANDYTKQQYLNNVDIQFTKQNGYVKGSGAVEYQFFITNINAGWYELWMEAAGWPTDIFLAPLPCRPT
jgi:hypothetical protein